jgi:hypothetical protein
MRMPRIRLRSLMALVVAVALIMGATIEVRNYREWARYASFERQFLELADRFDRTAERERTRGDFRFARQSDINETDDRGHAEECAQTRRRLERAWYRYLGDGWSLINEWPTMPLACQIHVSPR